MKKEIIHAEYPMFSKRTLCGLKLDGTVTYGWLLDNPSVAVNCTKCLGTREAKRINDARRNPGC